MQPEIPSFLFIIQNTQNKSGNNTAITLSYILYKCTQLHYVNERSHNKALTLIVLFVSRSCALNPLNINAVTLHMPPNPLHIPYYTVPTTTALFGNNL
jgi:hypothetical protein